MTKTLNYENVSIRAMFFASVAVAGLLFVSPAFTSAQTVDRTTLTRSLDVGMSGADVSRLQTFLAKNTLVYPQGVVSGYYGALTRNAVAQFQIGYGLPPVGRVGPLTLAKINGLISAGNAPDINAPLIGNVGVTTTSTTAAVTWTTNESATGRVYYDSSPISMSETSVAMTIPTTSGTALSEQGFSESHSLTLSGLAPNKTYYYALVSNDVPGNVAVTLPRVFTTNP